MHSGLELAFCVIGIYATFLTWGLIQEQTSQYILLDGSKFQSPVFMNFIQNILGIIVGSIYMVVSHSSMNFSSLLNIKLIRCVILVAFTQSMSSSLGIMSTPYVGFLLYTLAKSCKLVPVMLIHRVLYKSRFPLHKYIVVGVVTTGVFLFSIRKKHENQENIYIGASLLLLSLLLDGITNATQDIMFKDHPIKPVNLMVLLNFFSGILTLIYSFMNDQLNYGYRVCLENSNIFTGLLLYGICGAVGQIFIFITLAKFGSLILIKITVTRKMMSMLLSVVFFGHKLGLCQWCGIALVFSGISFEAYHKCSKRSEKQKMF